MTAFQVERGFSILNSIRGKNKWLLSAASLDGLMKIRIEGPDIELLDVEKYTKLYLQNHLRCDDPAPYTWFVI